MSQKRDDCKEPTFSILNNQLPHLNQHLIDYPTPSNLSYWWGFGSLAGICLVIQIVTGIFLAMHYTPHVDLAFNSVEHIMRDVEGGWLLRYMHANGASMFFIVVYLHMFRGLYYASYSSPREFVRCIGVVIFLLMILTAFIGYVLPWGQMSFWGATVITSLASAIPVVGDTIVTWLWGGFSVDNATLNRFFSLHYLLPFILVGASVLHLAALHQYGSNNPLGVHAEMDKIAFYPYFYVKDLAGDIQTITYLLIRCHSSSCVPEWYFLPVYAILRRTFLLLADRCLLGWIGCQPVEPPFVTIGQNLHLFFSSCSLQFFLFRTCWQRNSSFLHG
ncbi:hypothetical protein MKW92_036228 [Papaver armeniacum]|nr:hypothetical protein MKW92_036228 [Papaver armeniacum]